MRLDIGEPLEVEVEACSTAAVPLHVAYCVAVTSLSSSADMGGTGGMAVPGASPTGAAGGYGYMGAPGHYHRHHHSHHHHHHYSMQHFPTDVDLIDAGAVVAGATHNVHVGLLPGTPLVQRLRVAIMQPGFYQLTITDVTVTPLTLPQPAPGPPRTTRVTRTSSLVPTAPQSPLQSAGPSQSLPDLPPGASLPRVSGGGGTDGAGTGGQAAGPVREEEGGILGGGWGLEAAAEAVAAAVALGWPADSTPQRVFAASDKLNIWAM